MKIIKSKGLAQKIITSVTLIVVLFNIVIPTTSHAKFDWGGTLWNPIQNLVSGLGDIIFNVLQSSFIADAPKAVVKLRLSEIKNGSTGFSKFMNFLYGIPGIGWVTSAGAAGLANLIGNDYADTSGNNDVSQQEMQDYWSKEIPFPSIYYSVENIFANKIPAFDVNFINPSVKNPDPIPNGLNEKESYERANFLNDNSSYLSFDADPQVEENYSQIESIINSKIEEIRNNPGSFSEKQQAWANNAEKDLHSGDTVVEGGVLYNASFTKIYNDADDADITLDVPYPSTSDTNKDNAIGNIAMDLQETISTWYNALRNVAIVAMLSILVYIAIRIIISSAEEEAKYKIMLKDWFIAICLLFSMHYIMSFSIYLTESLTGMLDQSYQNALSQISTENGITSQTLATSVRVQVSFAEDTGEAMGYTILYALLVIYTIIFTWQYLKRVIYMAFLTLISPLVAMTYPIDKINDGKAQGFDMWLKEYIFNLLLQPLHLLLFMILALSAVDLFKTNIIYSLVVLGFLLQSIKILKKLFGFDSKAPIGGGGLAGGFAGGAVFSTLLNATKKVPQLGGGKGSKDSENKGIRTSDNSSETSETGGKGLGNLAAAFSESGSTTSGSTTKGSTTRGSTSKSSKAGKSTGTNSNTLGNRFRNQLNQNAQVPIKSSSNSSAMSKKDKKREERRKIIRGVSNVGKKYINVPKILKTTAKVSAGVIGAGTLGTIGVAAGLASDDYSDVAKFGLAGVAGGYAVGNTVGTSAANIASTAYNAPSNIKDTFEQGYYGSDYKKIKSNREYRESKEIDEQYKDKYGPKEWKQRREADIRLKELGLDNQKDIDKAHNLIVQGVNEDKAVQSIIFMNEIGANIKNITDKKERKRIRKAANSIFDGDDKKTEELMGYIDKTLLG